MRLIFRSPDRSKSERLRNLTEYNSGRSRGKRIQAANKAHDEFGEKAVQRAGANQQGKPRQHFCINYGDGEPAEHPHFPVSCILSAS